MIATSKWLAIVAVAFIAGLFIASPELRAYAANTVFSTDIVDGQVKTADLANNAVTAAKIKDGEVKAAEIAANAVGASEIIGVSNLIFSECTISSSTVWPSGTAGSKTCNVGGAGSGDIALATIQSNGVECFAIRGVTVVTDGVWVTFGNTCAHSATLGTVRVAIVVFDTGAVIIP